MPNEDIAKRKQALRAEAKVRRRKAHDAAGPGAGAMFADYFLSAADEIGVKPSKIVAGYWAMADEFDVRPLMERLVLENGVECALPVVVQNDAPLVFRRWRPGLTLEAGGFGTHHPPPDFPEVEPDILLVPLLAFDAAGYRMGWGGGFYDRTLAGLRERKSGVVAVGTAFAAQQIDAVIHDELDQPVDWVVTEKGAIRIGAS